MYPTGLLLSALLGVLCPFQRTKPAPAPVIDAATILERIAEPADILGARNELLALGAKGVPAQIEWLSRMAANDGALAGPDACRNATVMCALAAAPRDAVLACLVRHSRSGTDLERAAALGVLVHLGTKEELALALDLATSGAALEPSAVPLGDDLERALQAILSRDPSADRALADLVPGAQPAARTASITVLGRQDHGDSLALLASLLGRISAELDTQLMLEIGNLATRGRGSHDLLVLERVRGYLGHPDHTLAVLACVALEGLFDHEAVPDLIVLLSDADRNLSARAHVTLTRLTGLALPLQPEEWMAWLDEELTWWDERGSSCRYDIVSGEAAAAAAAVHELGRHRLFQHRSAQMLRLALERPEPDITRQAARVLATLRVAPDTEEDERPEGRRPQKPRSIHDRPALPGRIRSRT